LPTNHIAVRLRLRYDEAMDILTALGLAIPAGLNAYIPLLTVALAQRFGWLELRQPLDLLGEWWMIAIIAVLLVVEIVADKVPVVDSVNDAIQTVIRPVAGGLVAVAASGSAARVSPWLMVLAGVILAGGVHAAKALARPVIDVASGGAGAPVISAAEDTGAVTLSVLAIVAPIAGAIVIVIGLILVWRLYKRRKARNASPSPPRPPASK